MGNRAFELVTALDIIGIEEKKNLLAMHLSEIEGESSNVLDLMTALRAHTYRGDSVAGQETLAELTVAMEHLSHHLIEVVPDLQKELEIEP